MVENGIDFVLFDDSAPSATREDITTVLGILSGVLIGHFTEYFTSDSYKPTKKLAGTAETGCATEIIDGLGLGMAATQQQQPRQAQDIS